MKIFIVFAGLLVLNTSMMCYKADYERYMYLYRALDNIAFESVESAVLEGAEEALVHAEQLLDYTLKSLKNIKIRDYVCEVHYREGYMTAFIRIDVENLFRFPFYPVTSIAVQRKMQYSGGV